MTFNPDADISGNTTRRRGGRTAAIAGGGVGLGAIAVLLIGMFTGVDLSGFLGGGQDGGGGAAPSSQGALLDECKSGKDANANDDCRMAGAQVALDAYWSQQVKGYRPPQMTVVQGSTPTSCGTASNAVGPFYCPPEQGVYLDPTFFQLMRQQFGASAGNLAQLYIVGHEWGHHIQNIVGTMNGLDLQDQGPTSDGVRLELQADCYAGSWVRAASDIDDESGVQILVTPTDAEIADALNAAAAVGDDHIQETLGGGQVNPETWTHGSSESRQKWFNTGYTRGVGACDTFSTNNL